MSAFLRDQDGTVLIGISSRVTITDKAKLIASRAEYVREQKAKDDLHRAFMNRMTVAQLHARDASRRWWLFVATVLGASAAFFTISVLLFSRSLH